MKKNIYELFIEYPANFIKNPISSNIINSCIESSKYRDIMSFIGIYNETDNVLFIDDDRSVSYIKNLLKLKSSHNFNRIFQIKDIINNIISISEDDAKNLLLILKYGEEIMPAFKTIFDELNNQNIDDKKMMKKFKEIYDKINSQVTTTK